MSKRSWTNEQLIEAVKTSKTYKEIAYKLGLTNFGSNSKTIKKYITELKLDVTHFWTMSDCLRNARKNIKSVPNNKLFSENSTMDRKHVKNRIIKQKLIPYHCKECKLTHWHGKELSLHLDHINGINNDHRLENLRFLCPNCHSCTDTYCAKKLSKTIKEPRKCIDCYNQILRKSLRCKDCNHKARTNQKTKISWKPIEELIQMVKDHGYRGTGKILGVSDNAVKKRITNYSV